MRFLVPALLLALAARPAFADEEFGPVRRMTRVLRQIQIPGARGPVLAEAAFEPAKAASKPGALPLALYSVFVPSTGEFWWTAWERSDLEGPDPLEAFLRSHSFRQAGRKIVSFRLLRDEVGVRESGERYPSLAEALGRLQSRLADLPPGEGAEQLVAMPPAPYGFFARAVLKSVERRSGRWILDVERPPDKLRIVLGAGYKAESILVNGKPYVPPAPSGRSGN